MQRENAEELMVVAPGTVGGQMQPKRYEVVRGPEPSTKRSVEVLKSHCQWSFHWQRFDDGKTARDAVLGDPKNLKMGPAGKLEQTSEVELPEQVADREGVWTRENPRRPER
jgi:hypothetical protein